MAQKTINYEELQLAHHLVNDLFRILGTMNPLLYPAPGAVPFMLGAHPELRQGTYGSYPLGPVMIPGWGATRPIVAFGQGFIPTH